MHAEERRELIERLSEATTGEEVEAAEQAAARYLRDHPHDHGVMAAQERLDRRRGLPRDPTEPERGRALRWTVALAATSIVAALVARALGAGWGVAFGVGVVLAVEALYWAWVFFGDRLLHRGWPWPF